MGYPSGWSKTIAPVAMGTDVDGMEGSNAYVSRAVTVGEERIISAHNRRVGVAVGFVVSLCVWLSRLQVGTAVDEG